MPDQLTPIVDRERRNMTWYMGDIYTGKAGSTGRYVPNVNDLVYSFDSGFYRCINVNYTTLQSVLIPWSFTQLNGGVKSEEDILISSGPGYSTESFRLYLNTQVIPYQFSIDTRLKIYSAQASYIKIFKENDIDGSSISAMFNAAGAMVTENIGLDVVAIPDTNVYAIKTPQQGYLTEKMETGDSVSVVVYSNSGGVLSIFKLVVVNTNFVRTIDMSKKLITDISLISPYLSSTDNTLLNYPSNIVVDSASLVGRVTYNDGTSETYPVNGSKFSMLGVDNYVASQIGQTVPLVLTYKLATDEYSNHIQQVADRRFMTKSYRLTTIDSDNMYSVKIFVVPKWNNSNNTWGLDFYLTNLDRDYIYLITPYIEYGVNSPVFDGGVGKWGVAQHITVAVNLDKVAPSFNYYRHVTDFDITVHQAGSNPTVSGYYTIAYDDNSIYTLVTAAKYKNTGNGYNVDISGGLTVVNDWLKAVYWSTSPLYFPFAESAAPTPTTVKLTIGNNWSRELPIDSILQTITGVNVPINQGDVVQLEFIAQYNTTRLILATTGLIAMATS